MGCLGSKSVKKEKQNKEPTSESESVPTNEINAEDYLLSKRKDETFVKSPNSIAGLQFQIEECENCTIFLLDYSDSITIDACKNCFIFVGPTQGSVFLRECRDCNIFVACQQFRTRDCENISTMLYCMTRPSIESSQGMRFGCFQYNYSELEAKLDVFTNNWSSIHDFSQQSDSWSCLSVKEQESFLENILSNQEAKAREKGLMDNHYKLGDFSLVPFTFGQSKFTKYNENALLIFPGDSSSDCIEVLKLLNELKQEANTSVMQTKKLKWQLISQQLEIKYSGTYVIGVHINTQKSNILEAKYLSKIRGWLINENTIIDACFNKVEVNIE